MERVLLNATECLTDRQEREIAYRYEFESWTQTDLARRYGVSQSTISDVVNSLRYYKSPNVLEALRAEFE